MIEANNPEINVDDIMEQIRKEIANRKPTGNTERASTIPPHSELFKNNETPTDLKIERLLDEPYFENRPDGIYRIQDLLQYNNSTFVENAYKAIFQRNPDQNGLSHYLNLLSKGISKVDLIGRLRFSKEGRKVGATIQGLTVPLIYCLILKIPVVGYLIHLIVLFFSLPKIQKKIRQDEQKFHLLKSVVFNTKKSVMQIFSMKQSITQQKEALQILKDDLQILEDRLKGHSADIEAHTADIKDLKGTISRAKMDLILQERRLSVLLSEARKRLPDSFNIDQLKTFKKEDEHLFDSLYLFFEDQFRGSHRDIKERFKFYLPIIRKANAGVTGRPILDIGSGRGEWLELIKEEGLKGHGVELSRVLVERCNKNEKIEVIEADAIEYLKQLPESCLGAVTAFHLIEHLDFKMIIAFLDEMVRVLLPSGTCIIETPNPENILVGANTFYLDPTHRHPLPPQMMRFLVESRGFCDVEVINLHPYGKEVLIEEDSAVAKRFNEYFYGPQDYAVIGYKA